MAARTAPSWRRWSASAISNVATDELVTIRVSTGVLTIVIAERCTDASEEAAP